MPKKKVDPKDWPVSQTDPFAKQEHPFLPIGKALHACSGGDIHMAPSANASQQKHFLTILPGQLSINRPKPASKDKECAVDKTHGSKSLPGESFGKIEDYGTDAPTLTLGNSVRMTGKRIHTKSKFLVLSLEPNKKRVVCKHAFDSLVVFASAAAKKDRETPNDDGDDCFPQYGTSARCERGGANIKASLIIHSARREKPAEWRESDEDSEEKVLSVTYSVDEEKELTRPRRSSSRPPRPSLPELDSDVTSAIEDSDSVVQIRPKRKANAMVTQSTDDDVSKEPVSSERKSTPRSATKKKQYIESESEESSACSLTEKQQSKKRNDLGVDLSSSDDESISEVQAARKRQQSTSAMNLKPKQMKTAIKRHVSSKTMALDISSDSSQSDDDVSVPEPQPRERARRMSTSEKSNQRPAKNCRKVMSENESVLSGDHEDSEDDLYSPEPHPKKRSQPFPTKPKNNKARETSQLILTSDDGSTSQPDPPVSSRNKDPISPFELSDEMSKQSPPKAEPTRLASPGSSRRRRYAAQTKSKAVVDLTGSDFAFLS